MNKHRRIFVIIKILGSLIGILGAFMLIPLAISWYKGESDTNAFLFSIGICFSIGAMVQIIKTRNWRNLYFQNKDGFLTVTLAWLLMVLCGSLPFLFSGSVTNITDACFESMSGFTTTGSTVFSSVESLPHGILLWRALSQWIGGIGVIVFFVAALPMMGLAGNALFVAEITGPIKDKINPRIKSTAKMLCIVYFAITLVEIIALIIAGMSVFDAICHSFSTVATGGFSTKNASAAAFSPSIQYILMLFMFLSGINFSLYYFVIKRDFKWVCKNEELKTYILYVLISGIAVSAALYFFVNNYATEQSFREGFFQCISLITTTGFVSAEFNYWPNGIRMILLLLLFAGACAGSSSGGIKVVRILLMIKNAILEFKRASHPRAVLPLKMSGMVVKTDTVRRILAFFFLYIAVFLFGILGFSIMGYNVETSFGIAASSMGNVGPSFGEICSMCSVGILSIPAKWLAIFLMLVGRLEVFTVLILLVPSFWKNY
ncbi:MAG: TrkH family potassium uptake protein [Bacteroidales bacterium]